MIRSLFTSLMPPLALTGVGNAIATSRTLRAKILLVNGTHDRETEDMTAGGLVSEQLTWGVSTECPRMTGGGDHSSFK